MAQSRIHAEEKDVLAEAAALLIAPSRDIKRKLLIFFNVVIGLSVLVFNVYTLVKHGNFAHPERDWVMYPAILGIMFGSGAYNLVNLIRNRDGHAFLNSLTAWSTVVLLQIVSVVTVQLNTNIALSVLWDVSISLLMIFITGVMLGRWAGLAYSLAAIGNMFLAANRLGWTFVYELDGFVPKTLTQFVVLWVLVLGIGALVTFTEGGVISKILNAIPLVVDRIRQAGEQRRKLELENVRMGAELDVAQRLQMMVLPRPEELAVCTGLLIAASMEPATEVGGDYYDVLPKGDVTFIAVGDVTDHGLASGVVMLMVQAAFRILLEDPEPSLQHALNRLNALLYKNVQGRLQDSRNMTLSLLRHENGRLTVCGQHEKVFVCRAGGQIEMYDTGDLGMYVGLVDDISKNLSLLELEIKTGDQVLLYTDGATEAENLSREQFGEKRLGETLARERGRSQMDIIRALSDEIHRWMGKAPLYDDITLVLLRKT